MERDSFVFYRSFAEALKEIDAETKAKVVDMLCDYALDGNEPEERGIAFALFALMKPQIDANNQRYENGKKGGRPKTEQKPKQNQAKTKTKPKQNQEETKTEPNVNVNVNENVNVNVNDNNPPIIPPQEKPTRHKYGEYNHVLLSDDEYQNLCSEFGELLVVKAIRYVDEYCETFGKTYKNYNLAIRRWGIDRAREDETKKARDDPYRAINEWYAEEVANDDERGIFGFG